MSERDGGREGGRKETRYIETRHLVCMCPEVALVMVESRDPLHLMKQLCSQPCKLNGNLLMYRPLFERNRGNPQSGRRHRWNCPDVIRRALARLRATAAVVDGSFVFFSMRLSLRSFSRSLRVPRMALPRDKPAISFTQRGR